MHTDKPAKFALLFPAMSEAILHRSRAGLSQELLPGLTHLNWSISRSEDAQGLFHFMSRHMIHLELNITSKCPLDRLAYLSDSLQSLSPPLTTFVLVPPEDEESHTSLSKYVVGGIQLQPGIEHLKLTEAVFFTAILHPPSLNQLRSLKSLCLLQSNSSKPFDHSLPKSGLPCPDLRTLTGNGVSIWKHIVPLVGATIDTIDITNPRITTNLKDVLNIFSVIGTSCPLLSVLRLFWLDFVATTKQVEGVFRPLLRCQHLSVLVVGCGMASVDISYALSEGDFTEMGRAWPKLESLLLYGPLMKRTQHTKPPLQLRSILVLRRYCPKLQHLALSLDATNTEHPPTSFPGDTPLQTLYVGSSWINDSFAVAKWIVDLCPAIGLSSIDAVDEIPSRVQLWLEVQKAVEYIQDIRQQEKEKTKDLTRRLKSSETETAKLLAEVETLRLAYAVLAKQLHAAEGDAEGDSSDGMLSTVMIPFPDRLLIVK
jgi:hypothetical protein